MDISTDAIWYSYRYATTPERVRKLHLEWQMTILAANLSDEATTKLLELNSERAVRKVRHPLYGIKRKRFHFGEYGRTEYRLRKRLNTSTV